MSDENGNDELLASLLDELMVKQHAGELSALDEYCVRYPELASRMRELLPMMLIMEQHKPFEEHTEGATTCFSRSLPKIGDYQIIREIGRGGMGIVYEARQLSLGRHVALKVISQHLLGHQSAIERFRREARSAARLHHTNIVPVFEVGQEGDVSYYAMQFIQGQAFDELIGELRKLRGKPLEDETQNNPSKRHRSLAESLLIRDATESSSITSIGIPPKSDNANPEPMIQRNADGAPKDIAAADTSESRYSTSWPDGSKFYFNVARIALQIAEALRYAHGKNVIHRDIKPSNVLLDAFGTAWLTDFGLAKYEDASDEGVLDSPLTQSGDIVGTLRYMAPERLRGRHDPRTDIYGLGITLYELLTLQPVYPLKPRAELLEQVTRSKPVAPRLIDPRIPRDLETIVIKSIEKEPTRRYASADDMAEDLRRFIANEPIRARRIGPLGRTQLWFRRNRWSAVAVVTSVLLLIILAAGSTVASFVFRAQRDRANQFRDELESSTGELRAKSWESHLTAARGLRLSRTHGQRFAALREIKAACELPIPPGHTIDELRTEAIGALCLPDFEVAHKWKYPPESKIVGFDRWLSRYALSDSSEAVSVLGVEDQKVQFRLSSIGAMSEYGSVVFANDDITLAQYSGGHLRVFRIVEGSARLILDSKDVLCYDFDFSGSRIAIVNSLNAVEIRDTTKGKLEQQFESTAILDGNWVRWNPKRNILAIGSQLLDMNSGTLQSIEIPFGRMIKTAWDPTGQILAITNDSDAIFFWDIDREKRWPAIQPVGVRGTIAAFNSIGNRMLCTNWNHNWNLIDVNSGNPLMSIRAGQAWLGFTPDDRLAGADVWAGECRLYRFASGQELSRFTADQNDFSYDVGLIYGRPILSKDDEWLMLGYSGGASRMVELNSGLPSFPIEIPGRPIGFDTQDQLLTIGDLGLLRWPISRTGEATTKIGPPQHLADLFSADDPSFSAEHEMLIVPRMDEPTLVGRVDENGYEEVRTLAPQRDVRSTKISPDGNWLVTGSHGGGTGSGCKIWNAKDGTLVAELPVVSAGRMQFSPDGAWMLTPGSRPQLWRTSQWTEGPKLNAIAQSGAGCFSPDSRFLILEDEPDYVRMFRTTDGEEIAKIALPASPSSRLWPVKLTESGRLILVGVDNDTVYELDLRLIRTELAELGLDWEQPPFSPDAIPTTSVSNVEVDLGEIGIKWQSNRMMTRADELYESRKFDEAISLLRSILKSEPDHVSANNLLAWILATGPQKIRNPDEAVERSLKVTKAFPEDPSYLNTLGTVLYRAGRWSESITALEKSTSLGNSPEEYNLYLLAMCYAQTDQSEKARQLFLRAESGMQANAANMAEISRRDLQEFQNEARQTLTEKEAVPIDPPPAKK